MEPDLPPARTVACPTCKGLSRYAVDNPWRPFCSERCRQIDLGAWASEGFRVPVAPAIDPPDDSSPADPLPH